MTINIGAVTITFIGLVLGLCGLGLAWRLVRGLHVDEHPAAADKDDDAPPSGTTEHED